MNAIEITGLTKHYKGRCAVDSLSLSIKQGEVLSLLGANGAGKTTTIKMLCCLSEPTSGDALILGDSIVKNPEAVKQKLNISPQETAVAHNLTVRENLEFIAEIYGACKRDARIKAQEMLDEFKLVDRANERAKSLSGGLARRLSIAMALISSPEILFLDEPTLGLDVRARTDLWRIIFKLKGKITIILTTHYLEEATAVSDRIAIMHEGRLRALGSADEILKASGKDNIEDAFLALTEEEII